MDAKQAEAAPPESEQVELIPTAIEQEGQDDGSFSGDNEDGKPTGDGESTIANLKTPADVARFMAGLKAPAAEPPAGESEEEEGGEGEEGSPPASEEEGAEDPPEGEEEEEAEAAGKPKVDVDDLPTRFRITRPKEDKVGRMAAVLMHENKGWTMKQAVLAAERALSLPTDEPAKPEADGAGAKPGDKPAETPALKAKAEDEIPAELTALDAEIAQTRAQRKAAMADVDMARAADLDDKLDELREKRFTALAAHERAKTQRALEEQKRVDQEKQEAAAAEARYKQEFDAAGAKAAELYPFVADVKSPLRARMKEIDKALQENDDPLFHDPKKPLRIAQMVAAEAGIAPKPTVAKKQAAPAAAKPPPSTKPVGEKSRPPIASGDSRTKTGRTEFAALEKKISSLKTPEQLNAFMEDLGSGKR